MINTSTHSCTILVVDDNPTNIQVLFDVLNASGYQVAVAKTGESALNRLHHHLPDLILLDVMMPGMDGFETCRRLKAHETTRDIPVIFMTALSDTVDRVRGLSLGAVDYITKPIQHEEVLARIRVHLQLRQLTQTLEQQVADRTADLRQALDYLQRTQVQLVQTEKMSSLGQLVAGVAHEINNPVNFIYGNLSPAQDYVHDLMDLVQLFCAELPELPLSIQDRMAEMDFEFIQEDLPRLLKSMKIGADRIRQIVLSLRNFSRLDEADMKPVNIHDGIDSTLMILQHRLKAKPEYPAIEVIKDYGEIPAIECYASQLNQVFMNLLSNAIDALEETMTYPLSEQSVSPTIWIQTGLCDRDRAFIKITDNGPGMTSDVQAKLFDTFFTTKPIGKGTGLGLSISYQIIVEKHHGQLVCHSTLGQGTTFTIELPIWARYYTEPGSLRSEQDDFMLASDV